MKKSICFLVLIFTFIFSSCNDCVKYDYSDYKELFIEEMGIEYPEYANNIEYSWNYEHQEARGIFTFQPEDCEKILRKLNEHFGEGEEESLVFSYFHKERDYYNITYRADDICYIAPFLIGNDSTHWAFCIIQPNGELWLYIIPH